ncbi:hypothetical protein GIB67_025919 [Kingdonia uniflora]|uniref:Uncharacterized protein n=1 Tax=Kingdonia uniflora TaxID=39325 RepID=A0A7J7NZQ1_9MAGN|nr:hypothetical protein GIB67_025919 [Kingdonia uniflora]
MGGGESSKWLDCAINDSIGSSRSSSSFTGGCFGCGAHDHWWRECPWRTSNCTVDGYGAPKRLCTSKTEATKGQKFLKCTNPICKKSFTWLKDAMQEEKQNKREEKTEDTHEKN